MRKINPAWTEEELILALQTLRQVGESPLRKEDERILKFSRLLNALPIHPDSVRANRFRDPDGVRRRLNYFRQLDSGRKLVGHQRYRVVWDRYHNDSHGLAAAATRIKARYAR